MIWLSDKVVAHLREVSVLPDFTGTRYRLLEEVARGGMGIVYAAEDTVLKRHVAVKVLELEDLAGEASARILREARVLAGLEHPNIVPVHDAGTLPDGRVFYAMKLVRGETLAEWAKHRVSRADRLRVFLRVADAVAFAHSRGVIHRDLKPENIMVGAFGEVLVMDWGVARVRKTPEPPAVVGTPAYMAPEQAEGRSGEADERTDVYALGGVLEFLVPGRRKPPKALESVCRKAKSAAPEERYNSVSGLAADVAAFLDGLPVSAHRDGPLELVGRHVSNNPTLALLVAAYVVVRLVLFFLSRS